jgi:hypothetical protein
MKFLVNTERNMYGNLVWLLGNVIICSTNVFSLIRVNKLITHTQSTISIPLLTFTTFALISSIVRPKRIRGDNIKMDGKDVRIEIGRNWLRIVISYS